MSSPALRHNRWFGYPLSYLSPDWFLLAWQQLEDEHIVTAGKFQLLIRRGNRKWVARLCEQVRTQASAARQIPGDAERPLPALAEAGFANPVIRLRTTER